jgi:hypothetical protein
VLIDVVRAILVLWMINSHALGRAQVPAGSLLQWIRPTGWATNAFVMLTGFAIALIYLPGRAGAGARRQLWHRSWQLAFVGYVTNLVYVSLRLHLEGALTSDGVVRLATLREPWGYSAILIPTCAVLIVAPALIQVVRRWGAAPAFALATACAVALDIVSRWPPEAFVGSNVFQALVHRNEFVEFPVLSLFAYGVWAFTFGAILLARRDVTCDWPWVVGAGAAALAVLTLSNAVHASHPGFVVAAARFPLVLALGLLVVRVPVASAACRHLAILGQAALLVYVLHRPLLQALDMALPASLHGERRAMALLVPTLTTVLAVSHLKMRNRRLRSALRRVGF